MLLTTFKYTAAFNTFIFTFVALFCTLALLPSSLPETMHACCKDSENSVVTATGRGKVDNNFSNLACQVIDSTTTELLIKSTLIESGVLPTNFPDTIFFFITLEKDSWPASYALHGE